MQILLLTPKMPYPPHDGGSMAVLQLAKALDQSGHQVTVLAMNTSRHPFSEDQIPSTLRKRLNLYSAKVDNRLRSLNALRGLFASTPYHISRFLSNAYTSCLKELLELHEFQVVQLEGLPLAPYIPVIRQYSKARIVMRAHNVEYLIWERLSAIAPNLFHRWYFRHSARQLRKYEGSALTKYDALLPISDIDSRHFMEMGWSGPTHILPPGLDPTAYVTSTRQYDTLSCCFIGALDWLPNRQGVQWLLKAVINPLVRKHNHLHFHIAGRHMPLEWQHYTHPQVHMAGEVDDATAFLKQHPVLLVPLFAGSGVRIKILEAMFLGKTVITTRLGAEGIEATDGHHLLIADDGAAFRKVILKCIEQPAQVSRIGRAARQFVLENYDIHKLIPPLTAFYENLQ